ncbi:MAG: ADP-ribosylation factor-like protein, partial [Promethearchaeia archaeon]
MLIKLLYWGMVSSGKTTAVDTLYRITKEYGKDMIPVSPLTKISMRSGATLYFDRGVFQSNKLDQVKFHIYTVAGQKQFAPLRNKVFKGTEGVIFMVDSQTHLFEEN